MSKKAWVILLLLVIAIPIAVIAVNIPNVVSPLNAVQSVKNSVNGDKTAASSGNSISVDTTTITDYITVHGSNGMIQDDKLVTGVQCIHQPDGLEIKLSPGKTCDVQLPFTHILDGTKYRIKTFKVRLWTNYSGMKVESFVVMNGGRMIKAFTVNWNGGAFPDGKEYTASLNSYTVFDKGLNLEFGYINSGSSQGDSRLICAKAAQLYSS